MQVDGDRGRRRRGRWSRAARGRWGPAGATRPCSGTLAAPRGIPADVAVSSTGTERQRPATSGSPGDRVPRRDASRRRASGAPRPAPRPAPRRARARAAAPRDPRRAPARPAPGGDASRCRSRPSTPKPAACSAAAAARAERRRVARATDRAGRPGRTSGARARRAGSAQSASRPAQSRTDVGGESASRSASAGRSGSSPPSRCAVTRSGTRKPARQERPVRVLDGDEQVVQQRRARGEPAARGGCGRPGGRRSPAPGRSWPGAG